MYDCDSDKSFTAATPTYVAAFCPAVYQVHHHWMHKDVYPGCSDGQDAVLSHHVLHEAVSVLLSPSRLYIPEAGTQHDTISVILAFSSTLAAEKQRLMCDLFLQSYTDCSCLRPPDKGCKHNWAGCCWHVALYAAAPRESAGLPAWSHGHP